MLVDEEDRRYFKQQEIILWRKADKTRKPFQASLQQQYKQMQNPNVQFSNSDQSITGSGRNLGVGASGDNIDSSREDGLHPVAKSSNSRRSDRSPLEQSSSSEQPTPDKEFQSVINSNAADEDAGKETPPEEPEPTPKTNPPLVAESEEDSPAKVDTTTITNNTNGEQDEVVRKAKSNTKPEPEPEPAMTDN